MTQSPASTCRDSIRPLRSGSVSLRLWKLAHKHGCWNPDAFDFAAERAHWAAQPAPRRTRLLHLLKAFRVGEESVAKNLIPLIAVVSSRGPSEDVLYLSSFLLDEAKHYYVTDRIAHAFSSREELDQIDVGAHTRILSEEVESSLQALSTDDSVEAQVRASVSYHLVVEGVQAGVAFAAIRHLIDASGRLAALRSAFASMERDESRHIAFGMYFLRSQLRTAAEKALPAMLSRVAELRPLLRAAEADFRTLLAGEDAVPVDAIINASRDRFANRLKRLMDNH